MKHVKLFENFVVPGSIPDHYKNEFENQLKSILEEVGENAEEFYMAMTNKMTEWLETYRYEKESY